MRRLTQILIALGLFLSLGSCITTQPFVRATPSQPPAVDADALKEHVRHLSVDLYPRSFDFPKNLNAAADYISLEWQKTGAQVTEQIVEVEGDRYRNLIVQFGPAPDAEHPLTIIGAHYDSHGDAINGAKLPAGYSNDTHTPGADDNASGVAGIIELAKMFQQHPPSRAIQLVAYTLEEPPHYATRHMGSVWHAQSLKASAQPVDLMISLEMIGYFTDASDSQNYPIGALKALYPNTGNFIAIVGRPSDWRETRALKSAMRGASDLAVASINTTPLIPGVNFSDHRSYWQADYRAVMVTDTAFMRNHEYHQGGDTYDRLDYTRMAQVVQGVHAYAARP